MKLLACVEQAAEQLEHAQVAFGHGTINAFDEAAWLTLWALKLPLDSLEEHADQELTPAELTDINKIIFERITTRRPLAYLTHEAWLQGVPFYVDERVIVPRSFIAEILATGLIDPWLTEQTQSVLDLCTGNGSLAVLAALSYPEVQVTGADISAEALEVAQLNIERHGLTERIHLHLSDLFETVHDRYDLILCNPPYVNSQAMALLPPEYQAEPQIALAGGSDGMDFIRRLLRDAAIHMQPEAILVLEIGHERAHFEAAFPTLEPLWLETSGGTDQVLLLTYPQLMTFASESTT